MSAKESVIPRLNVRDLSVHHIGPVELSVEKGECVCIAGPSGIGKSLLLRGIADIEPHDGEVLLDGVRATTYAPPQWRRQVGLLPAESAWWLETVAEHFTTVDEQQLQTLGLTTSILGTPVSQASTGERQRLALLRLLQNQPKVLLLDEPTSGLDPENTKRVETLLQIFRQQHQASILWISHDPSQIRRVCDRSLTFNGRSLTEQAA